MPATRVLFVSPSGDDGADGVDGFLRDRGRSVTTVESSTAAVRELLDGHYDCLVTEYELPGDDGLELLRTAVELEPQLPVILFADAGDDVATKALNMGAQRFIPRGAPDALERLDENVTEVTESSPSAPAKQDISDHEPGDDEIVHAIDEAPIGITLADPALPDEPLVYINEAFERVTGYPTDYVRGRNCRFLQGPDTDPETVGEMRSAIEREEPVTVVVRNYRKDGSPFWNEVTIAPIYDDDGELVHYVGFQSDVSERERAKRTAEKRAESLRNERVALERILERVNGVLSDVARALVEETDRRAIEKRVCETVVSARGYGAAWIGEMNAPGTRIELRESAGLLADADTSWEVESLPRSVGDAIESGRVEGSSLEPRTDGDTGLNPIGCRRIVVVPLAYGRTTYGLLAVYSEDADSLDRREEVLFESIGRMVASGLNAVETTRILTVDRVTELVFEIRDPSFPLSAVADMLDDPVEYVGLTEGATAEEYHLYLTVAGSASADPAVLTDLPFVEDVRKIADRGEQYAFSIVLEGTTPFVELADYGATVQSISAERDSARLVVHSLPEHDHDALLKLLESEYDAVELRSKRDQERRDRTAHEFVSDVESSLSDRQYTALKTAHLNGYFEWPRPVDGTELADSMDISRQTFHQHLRLAQRKLVDAFFEE
ncbi:PAS domain S-box [Halalkaliarchaeum desulfuricum]|uniref:PAS domain S-box n=1 Tax=Halalkaliarchaeum desulfuricum TaxID=2055893 RepID=A0A343TMT2_9EURY|nr:bacterio-opsin activator domain-containing protein [Halalkaliarchaeum desulfuricum]AUX10404.1 PAS domain S-box [Halalkaliarchaeum desulfuricum]